MANRTNHLCYARCSHEAVDASAYTPDTIVARRETQGRCPVTGLALPVFAVMARNKRHAQLH